MYSVKDSYNILKVGTIGGLVSAASMALIIPILGLAVHGVKYFGDDSLKNYSLKNRFETAYSFKTPENHKYFYSVPTNGGAPVKEPYCASPYGTYGLIVVYGFGGALASAKFAAEGIRNKKEKLLAAKKMRSK